MNLVNTSSSDANTPSTAPTFNLLRQVHVISRESSPLSVPTANDLLHTISSHNVLPTAPPVRATRSLSPPLLDHPPFSSRTHADHWPSSRRTRRDGDIDGSRGSTLCAWCQQWTSRREHGTAADELVSRFRLSKRRTEGFLVATGQGVSLHFLCSESRSRERRSSGKALGKWRGNTPTNFEIFRTMMYIDADANMSTYEDQNGQKQTRLNLIQRSFEVLSKPCLLYTSPSPRDGLLSRMPSSA